MSASQEMQYCPILSRFRHYESRLVVYSFALRQNGPSLRIQVRRTPHPGIVVVIVVEYNVPSARLRHVGPGERRQSKTAKAASLLTTRAGGVGQDHVVKPSFHARFVFWDQEELMAPGVLPRTVMDLGKYAGDLQTRPPRIDL